MTILSIKALYLTLSIRTHCHYVECRYAESRVLFIVMLNVIILSVVMPSVVKLSVAAPGDPPRFCWYYICSLSTAYYCSL